LSAAANAPAGKPLGSIAGSVLPIKRAEELLATLPGIIAARIVASDTGAVDEIHLLTTAEVTPKQTVRNVESALIAHFGMRIDHRKISVATSVDTKRPLSAESREERAEGGSGASGAPVAVEPPEAEMAVRARREGAARRKLYFEDVEVRRSRSKGVQCRVTLRKGEESYIGEAEGLESERSRVDLAARAALSAILLAEGGEKVLALDGAMVVEAYGREFVFAGVTARDGRDSLLMTGSCEIRESSETASVLAVLDATNRWIGYAARQ
jgi:hypothetical protein